MTPSPRGRCNYRLRHQADGSMVTNKTEKSKPPWLGVGWGEGWGWVTVGNVRFWRDLACATVIDNNKSIKRKILSLETILSAYTHARTHARTHTHTHTHAHILLYTCLCYCVYLTPPLPACRCPVSFRLSVCLPLPIPSINCRFVHSLPLSLSLSHTHTHWFPWCQRTHLSLIFKLSLNTQIQHGKSHNGT